MSTQHIKDHLAEFFPNEAFKRVSKCKDSLGYTHRVMESCNRILVITTDCDEDNEICNQVEVIKAPLASQMKDLNRSYLPLGPLQGFVFDHGKFDGVDMWMISPEYLWSARQCLSDGHGNDELLSQYGFISLMESVYESQKNDVKAVNNLLLSLGAKKISMPKFQ